MFQALENREKLSGLSARWVEDVGGGGGGLQSARADASPGTRLRRLLVGTKLCAGAQAGLGPRMAGRGSGRGLRALRAGNLSADVAVTLWVHGGVGLCVRLCS